MSENATISRFCKCGDLHHLSRRFRNLGPDQKRYAIELIGKGEKPEKAIKLAKIKQQELFQVS